MHFIRGHWYRVIVLTQPLRDERGGRWRLTIDHPQHVIWLDPGVCPAEREAVIARAVTAARLRLPTAA